jgi:hypothetical protein
VAREVLESKYGSTIYASMHVKFQCTLPLPGDPTEPAWLQKFRKRTPAAAVWSGQDYDEITHVKPFPLHLDYLYFKLVDDDQSGDGFGGDLSGFLLLLEGLDWQ